MHNEMDHILRFPVISTIPEVQAHYESCRRNGCSEALSEMLATRSFPGTKGTDRAFMQGRHLDGAQFQGMPPGIGQEYVQKALSAGVNPVGKYYSGPLAAFPGDPRAWVDGLDDVRRIARERGLAVQGAVDIEPPRYHEVQPQQRYRVDPEIVAERVADQIEEHPELAVRKDELVRELTETMSGVHGQR